MSKIFFGVEKNIFLNTFLDSKFRPSSNGEVFRAIPALLRGVWSNLIQPKSRKTIKSRLRSFSKTSILNNSETYCNSPVDVRSIELSSLVF